jgi:hypothetical protein
MGIILDLVGQLFGRLLVIKKEDKKHLNGVKWVCACDCGKQKTILTASLTSGKSQSCGCLRNERTTPVCKRRTIYLNAAANPVEHNTWRGMISRCTNPKNKSFHRYGGRGIIVDDRWLGASGFDNFLLDMGKKPSIELTLGRKDNDGNYGPENCRWETDEQQRRSRSDNHWIEYNGRRMIVADWANFFGLSWDTMGYLIKTRSFDVIFNKYGPKQPEIRYAFGFIN